MLAEFNWQHVALETIICNTWTGINYLPHKLSCCVRLSNLFVRVEIRAKIKLVWHEFSLTNNVHRQVEQRPADNYEEDAYGIVEETKRQERHTECTSTLLPISLIAAILLSIFSCAFCGIRRKGSSFQKVSWFLLSSCFAHLYHHLTFILRIQCPCIALQIHWSVY